VRQQADQEIHLNSTFEALGLATPLLRAIAALPEAYRETLMLRLVEGMSGQQIADLTGLTPASVRVNLHRGMARLRAALGLAPTANAELTHD
jgi:RNA polymerase sigma-70 factor (ECF subfamily)